jgi:hypothetical protein
MCKQSLKNKYRTERANYLNCGIPKWETTASPCNTHKINKISGSPYAQPKYKKVPTDKMTEGAKPEIMTTNKNKQNQHHNNHIHNHISKDEVDDKFESKEI